MKKFRFFLSDNLWWIDVPNYVKAGGRMEDLEMIRGADIVLNWIGEGKTELFLNMSDKEFKDARPIYKANRPCDEGCYYLFAATDLITDHWGFWLSDVIKYIFNGFPNVIYYKLAEDEKKIIKSAAN